MSKKKIENFIENGFLNLEVFHNNESRQDKKIGDVFIKFKKLKGIKFEKTEFSYVKILDSFFKIIDCEENSEENLKIGELRVKIFLEDLGPVEMISKFDKEKKEIFEKMGQDLEIGNNCTEEIEEFGQNFKIEELEMKVIWELESWKKNEEQKFILDLKKKEIEFMTDLQEKINEKEKEKEKYFINFENKLNRVELDLKSKANNLLRRENIIKNYEKQIKIKLEGLVDESVKYQNEIKELKKKFTSEKTELIKKLKINEKLKKKLEDKIEEKENVIKLLKKNIEDSPLNNLQNDINEKDQKIYNLKEKINKYEELKKEFMDLTTNLQKKLNEFKKENQFLKNEKDKNKILELEMMKLKNNSLQKSFNFNEIRNEINTLKLKNNFEMKNNFKNENNFEIKNNSKIQNNYQIENDNFLNKNPELSNLIEEKNLLINMGIADDDIMMMELEKEINKFKN